MSIQEIERAVTQLPPDDLVEFATWFDEFQAQAWDEQIARDAHEGRFDSLIERAKAQVKAGESHKLTPNGPLVP